MGILRARDGILVTVGMLVLLACSSSDEGGAKPFVAGKGTSTSSSSSSSSSSSGGDDDDVILPPVIETDAGNDAAPPTDMASPFRGTLATTPTTKFGGAAQHCTYSVKLTSVVIDLSITPAGIVIGGSANNNMVEAIVGSCPFAPLGTVAQTFTLAQVNGSELTFNGSGGPKTGLTVRLTRAGDSWEAASTWERMDQTNDLKWVVNSKVTLKPGTK